MILLEPRWVCLAPFVSAIAILSGCALYPPGPVVQNYEKYDHSCLSQDHFNGKDDINKYCSTGTPSAALDGTDSATDTAIDNAIDCAKTTENVYGGFLLCRENEQIVAGVAIGTLAAAAAAVATSGISSVAAVSLGGAREPAWASTT